MLPTTKRRLWIVLSGLGLLLAASVLTACSFSVSGGLAGLMGALTLGAALLGLGASASGCDCGVCLSPIEPCLSQAFDARLAVLRIVLGLVFALETVHLAIGAGDGDPDAGLA